MASESDSGGGGGGGLVLKIINNSSTSANTNYYGYANDYTNTSDNTTSITASWITGTSEPYFIGGTMDISFPPQAVPIQETPFHKLMYYEIGIRYQIRLKITEFGIDSEEKLLDASREILEEIPKMDVRSLKAILKWQYKQNEKKYDLIEGKNWYMNRKMDLKDDGL